MQQIVIGIGGSGARVVECLVHLCLAGLGPERLTIFLIDLDGSNGNVTQLRELLDDYERVAMQSARAHGVPWARTRIEMHGLEAWSPIGSDSSGQNLASFLELSHLRTQHPNLARLIESCYGTPELEQDLRGGFRAMPAIGAAVFGATIDRDAEAWKQLASKVDTALATPSDAHVVVTGSAFGGTGASGFPTVPPRLLRLVTEPTDRLSFGGVLLLPYFGFKAPEADGVVARAEDFTVQTHAALTYYSRLGPSLGYDRIYLLGDASRADYEPSAWGSEQKNPVHFVELLGALACLDFFESSKDEMKKAPVSYIGRRTKHEFAWPDVPSTGGQNVQKTIGRSARIALTWHSTLKPAFESWFSGEGRFARSPWLVTLLEEQGMRAGDDGVGDGMRAFSRLLARHLRWMVRLNGEESLGRAGTSVRLFESGALTFPEDADAAAPRVSKARIPAFAMETARPEWAADWMLARVNAESARQLNRQGAQHLGVLQTALWNASA